MFWILKGNIYVCGFRLFSVLCSVGNSYFSNWIWNFLSSSCLSDNTYFLYFCSITQKKKQILQQSVETQQHENPGHMLQDSDCNLSPIICLNCSCCNSLGEEFPVPHVLESGRQFIQKESKIVVTFFEVKATVCTLKEARLWKLNFIMAGMGSFSWQKNALIYLGLNQIIVYKAN